MMKLSKLIGTSVAFLTLAATCANMGHAQSKPQVNFSGYVQPAIQVGSERAPLKVGAPRSANEMTFGRIGLRRAALKVQPKWHNFNAVFEIKSNDLQLSPKTMTVGYGNNGWSVDVGMQRIRFGYELDESSTVREMMDRQEVIGHLFPGDNDMSILVGYKTPKGMLGRTTIYFKGQICGGNSTLRMNKSYPDYMGRLAVTHKFNKTSLTYGASGYYGSTSYQLYEDVKRVYGDAFVKLVAKHYGGWFTLKSEFIMGEQPGLRNLNYSYGRTFNSDDMRKGVFIRTFMAGMATVTERLAVVPLEFFARYAYYNRNMKFDPTMAASLGDKSYRFEGVSHQIGGGVRYFLSDDFVVSGQFEHKLSQDRFNDAGRAAYFGDWSIGTVSAFYIF